MGGFVRGGSAIIAAEPAQPADYFTLYEEFLIMDMPALPLGSRRNEDIALDLMKFIAMTTGYGKSAGASVGFQGSSSADKPEDYAAHLLELYSRCLNSVDGK